jgi:hypothetical protein
LKFWNPTPSVQTCVQRVSLARALSLSLARSLSRSLSRSRSLSLSHTHTLSLARARSLPRSPPCLSLSRTGLWVDICCFDITPQTHIHHLKKNPNPTRTPLLQTLISYPFFATQVLDLYAFFIIRNNYRQWCVCVCMCVCVCVRVCVCIFVIIPFSRSRHRFLTLYLSAQ